MKSHPLSLHIHKFLDITTLATICNGVVECDGGEDEQTSPLVDVSKYGFLFVSVVVMLVYGLIRFVSHQIYKRYEREAMKEQIKLQQSTEFGNLQTPANTRGVLEEYEANHEDKHIISNVNLFMFQDLVSLPSAEITKLGIELYDLESRVHNGDETKIYTCLHKKIEPMIVKSVIDSKFPGLMHKTVVSLQTCVGVEFITKTKDYIREHDRLNNFLYSVKNMFRVQMSFIDLFKDLFITMILLATIGGVSTLVEFPTIFNTTYVMCMLVSIVHPLCLSTLHLAINNPGMVFGRNISSLRERRLMQVGVCLLALVNPLLLINVMESNRNKMREFAKHHMVETMHLLHIHKKIKMQIRESAKVELALESFTHVAAQLFLLMLATTQTPTVSGIITSQCWNSATGSLVLSILLGMKSCVLLHMKFIVQEKIFFRVFPKMALFIWAVFAASRRVLCIVSFFLPSFGMYSLLHHWQAEQIPFCIRLKSANNISASDGLELHSMTRSVLWSELDRWDYSGTIPLPPHYSLYTGLSLKWTFVAFALLFVCQFIILAVVKTCTSREFKGATIFNKYIHILQNQNIPFPYKDWDVAAADFRKENEGDLTGNWDESVASYKQRFARVEREMTWSYVVTFVFTIASMVPLLYTGRS